MGDDFLNQSEVESLLSAIEGSADDHPAAPATADQHEPRAERAPRRHAKVGTYDFKRPDRVGKEQMRALQTLHESFGRNFGIALSALLRSIVDVKLTSVDQLTYSEFVFSLENPTCFNLINAEPLESNLILDINPSILFPIIDRMLGGGRESAPLPRRPLTEIELRLVSRITKLFLDEMCHSWENVLTLKPSVIRVESNPQLVQIVPPNEVVVLISFELTLGDSRGMMNLCIPFNSIERVSSKLSANSWASYVTKPATPESKSQIGRQLSGSLVEVVVRLAATQITTGDLLGLRAGDIITTEHDVHAPVSVFIEGKEKFSAYPGAYKGHKAIQIEGPQRPRAAPSFPGQSDTMADTSAG
jgi:flagellar motor switch protein FliM